MSRGKNKRMGRPSLGDRKLVQRMVTSDPEVEQFLRQNPSVNASDVFRRGIHSLMPKDPDTIRLSKLAEEISGLRVDLATKEAEYNGLKSRVDDRTKLQLDLKLEQECHAWYFRSLVQAGIFNVRRRPTIDPDPVIRDYLNEPDPEKRKIHRYELESADRGWKLTDRATSATKRLLSSYIGRDGYLVPMEGTTYLTPSESDLYDRYSLRLDYKMFEKEYLSNPKIDDLPLEYFKQFSPIIRGTTQEMEGSIKRETKQKMMPFYQNPPEISVDEAKTRVEKPYRRGD